MNAEVYKSRKEQLIDDFNAMLANVDEDQYDDIIEAIAQTIEYDQDIRNGNLK